MGRKAISLDPFFCGSDDRDWVSTDDVTATTATGAYRFISVAVGKT